MKKLPWKFLLAFAALFFLFNSCAKDADDSDSNTTDAAKAVLAKLGSKVEIVSADTDVDGKSVVYFYYTQPVDHKNESAGTFKQYCSFHYEGKDKITVLHTQGYSTVESDNFKQQALALIYNANFIEVEHRYFKHSQIGDSENDYTSTSYWDYNTAAQSTADLHEIVTALKNTGDFCGKWISTGGSKNGILTSLYAYYYPNEVDVYVPFCAPFIMSQDELNIGTYVTQKCADGTTIQTKAWNALKFYLDPENEDFRGKVAVLYNDAHETNYSTDRTKLYVTFDYMRNMFQKFAYHNIYAWGDLIPTEKSTPEHFYKFATLGKKNFNKNRKALMEYLDKTYDRDYYEYENESYDDYENGDYVGGGDFEIEDNAQINDRAASGASSEVSENILSQIYMIHAAKELGYFLYDWGLFTDYLTEKEIGYFKKWQTIARYNTKYGVTYDNGKLMTDFIGFLQNNATNNKCKMLFIYSANDPWTGAAIPDSAKDDLYIKKYITALGVHSTHLNNTDHYSEAQKKQILDIINEFLK